MTRARFIDSWLDELILCGWPWPITRRQAADEMVKDGMSRPDAIRALCWYKRVEPETQP